MDPRSVERTKIIYYLRVFQDGADGDPLLGHVVDINEDGLMLVGDRDVPIGRSYSLHMDLPRNVMMRPRLTLVAECKWCRKDPRDDFYESGFRILSMGPSGLDTVKRLAREFYRESLEDDPALDMNPAVEDSPG